jgi:Fe-S-cluster containining protein
LRNLSGPCASAVQSPTFNHRTVDLKSFRKEADKKSPENKKFLQQLKKKDSRLVDDAFHSVHEEVFEEINCLTCANCCKTTSPIFYPNDIERIAKFLRMKPGDFTEQYLRIDEDNDFVLKSSPCPFLDGENYCSIYEARPKACREYPHTDRKKMVQIMELTYKNTLVCPAVLEMVERLKKISKI